MTSPPSPLDLLPQEVCDYPDPPIPAPPRPISSADELHAATTIVAALLSGGHMVSRLGNFSSRAKAERDLADLLRSVASAVAAATHPQEAAPIVAPPPARKAIN